MLPERIIENEPFAETSEQLQKFRFATTKKVVNFKNDFIKLPPAKFNIVTFPN